MKDLSQLHLLNRPRERIRLLGVSYLSDQELLAVILSNGIKGKGVLTLAQEILGLLDNAPSGVTLEELEKRQGIGTAKACLLLAAFEFTRRRIRPEGIKIRTADDVYPLVRHLADRKQEHFVAITLNGAHEVIAVRTITIGLVNRCQAHPREVFSHAISDRACAVIVAHNHPSGVLEASIEDVALTQRLQEAGELLGIRLLDHVIFSQKGFKSLAE